MTVFTSEEFKGYEFRCTTASANTGFKHICEVYKDNEPIDECLSVVNWGNYAWESYTYQSVFESSKAKLQELLEGIKKPEIDIDFLNRLANDGYIHDYGELEDGETVILMDSWEQVEGKEERQYVEGQGMVKTGNFTKSVYAKLCDLAEKGLLKPSINSTMLNVEYVFTDEYDKCWECGTVHNTDYRNLTYVEEEGMLLCDKCINSPERVAILIENAKEDFRNALKPTVEENIIKELGYSLVTTDTFSFARDRYFVNNVTEEWVQDFIERYDGFVQIYRVEQFDCLFQIWVSNENLSKAQAEVEHEFS